MTVTRPNVRGDGSRPAAAPAPQDRHYPGARSTYDPAVASGFYERDVQGLHGKYDNVRRYREDRITRQAPRGS